ncbi:BaiN/RdsA family NAD(P)/FAD-dependent oxidoreductase [Pseudosulfitobacter koreensis]|uniref:NAD(P)/FAD-dependent oxidoreductase n=1 Tax=Pseudosulfitobacter koreensis TaxID=2968472 RepID=A0ABT1YZR6_9RHOB|nr:NAD(P)/FAD-dependent oxidoreductase [Pseudosulfitobacter koreense]MCR8826380.1 NAD(P)/FAD-dependent oxidoreductase [Pseudosulfitobacter koreense]
MQIDTLIIGAGAAGMMCAAHAGGRVVVVDHAKAPGEKIRISGGGRCNFTNMYCDPQAFISGNPHFAKSALARYTQWDFIELIDRHGIAWHEKTLGQLFCDGSAKQIVAMLTGMMADAGVTLHLQTSVDHVAKSDSGFAVSLQTPQGALQIETRQLVLATGGKSIPKMGATGLAYDIARQFGLTMTETRPGLVPFTFAEGRFVPLAGVAAPSRMVADGPAFDEAVLFTHRGLSGPAVLQVSSYWREGDPVTLNLDPQNTIAPALRAQRQQYGRRNLTTELAAHLPTRLVEFMKDDWALNGNLADQSDARIDALADQIQNWKLTPTGTEGYRTAEVTLGGIDTDALSSKTMEAKDVPGLYVIGEAVDVTGWLGGYNFQWAWASGMAAARALAAS